MEINKPILNAQGQRVNKQKRTLRWAAEVIEKWDCDCPTECSCIREAANAMVIGAVQLLKSANNAVSKYKESVRDLFKTEKVLLGVKDLIKKSSGPWSKAEEDILNAISAWEKSNASKKNKKDKPN